MSKTSSQKSSRKLLGGWFERQKRVLPWRDRPEPYRVWISEIMLQQTQVITVLPFFERFLERFPTLKDLALAEEPEVMKLWAGLGYYSRARNLHRSAKILHAQGFPQTREGWLELPGVGEYTAGAILSIAFNQPEALLDGNVERVWSRLFCLKRTSNSRLDKEQLWKISAQWVRRAHEEGIAPRVFNQALMELGARVCTPRKPDCGRCPVAGICQARKSQQTDLFPQPKPRRVWKKVDERCDLVSDGKGRVLLRLRQKGEWRAGLWDLLEEAPRSAKTLLGEIETRHIVTHHKIKRITRVWRVASSVPPKAAGKSQLQWVNAQDLDHRKIPAGSALKKTLQEARKVFPGLRL